MIEKVKVWKADKAHRFAGEVRIYVDFKDGNKIRHACYYLSGNYFQKKGTLENMTKEEFEEVKKLAIVEKDGIKIWTNYTAEQKPVPYCRSQAAADDRVKREEEWARQYRKVHGLVEPMESGLV